MEYEPIFVRPTHIFAQPNDFSVHVTKTPCMDTHMDYADLPLESPSNDRLASYQSSPESTFSYMDGACFSPINDTNTQTENQILAMVRRAILPYTQALEPLSALPFTLGPLEAGLVTTYLSDYPQAAYGFSSTLQPHPMAAVLATTLQTQICLHFVIARAAAYRLSTHQYTSSREQTDLEVAMITHKGEAIQSVRSLSGDSALGTADKLMASMVGLGFLDSSTGADDTALMHFKAARRMLKSMDGPLKFKNVILSRLLLHFDCTNRPTAQSYLWDPEDFTHLHKEMNTFFGRLQSLWVSLAGQGVRSPSWSNGGATEPSQQPLHDLILWEGSIIRECLFRSPQDRSSPSQQDRQEVIFQLTSLLTICAVAVDHRSNPQATQDYIDSVHEMVENSQLQHLPTSNNIMWLLQINDHSEDHTKRIWAAAGWVWVLKHVNFNVQCMVRDWLMQFLTGQSPVRQLKLDSFAFSYAS